jgi:phage terminase Nu1 subunit (DNA packaging protein)
MDDKKDILYHGIKQCSSLTGIPVDLLKRARSHPQCPRSTEGGFADSGRVYMTDTFKKWLDDHTEELENATPDTIEAWQIRKIRCQALLAEYELEERRKSLVSKADVIDMMERIGAAQVSLFNSKLRQELPERWHLSATQVAELDGIITEIFDVITKGGLRFKK